MGPKSRAVAEWSMVRRVSIFLARESSLRSTLVECQAPEGRRRVIRVQLRKLSSAGL
jgi:hypothetical protein